MEDSSVQNMNQLEISQEQNGLRLSDQDAVLQSAIEDEKRSWHMTVILFSLLAGFFRETWSPDASYLAIQAGRTIAIKNGIPEEEFDEIYPLVVKASERLRKQNPLSEMF
jgi:hypothetical protein